VYAEAVPRFDALAAEIFSDLDDAEMSGLGQALATVVAKLRPLRG
jgi:hypothetical protein